MRIVEQLPEEVFKRTFMPQIDESVLRIIVDVRKNGDGAVRKYAMNFDGVKLSSLEMAESEIDRMVENVSGTVIRTLRYAATQIRKVARGHLRSIKGLSFLSDCAKIRLQPIPVKCAGIYVPGGRYPLASTALMGVIPAKVAGVREVIVCTPKPHPVTIAAAKIAGADRIFRIGGAQAIAAMAFGTESVPKVDVIAGPGNKYVQAAKRAVFGLVGIDSIAGPTEIVIIADESAKPSLVAADLIAQAEHDLDSLVLLLTNSSELARKVASELARQVALLPEENRRVAGESLKHGYIAVMKTVAAAIKEANKIAPEHLHIHCRNATKIAKQVRECGTVIIGECLTSALSDYVTGANHILPTGGAARFTGGLSVHNFLKFMTEQEAISPNSGSFLNAAQFATIEGLEGHRRAVLARIGRRD